MRTLSFVATLLACVHVLASPAKAPSNKFEGRDLFAIQFAMEPQIRPDGRAVAYVRVSFDQMTDQQRKAIWLIDVETGEQTPIVAGPGSNWSPRWSSNGDRLAYVSTVNGRGPQLNVRWMSSGASVKLSDLPAAPRDLAWSPDDRWIAFTSFVPEEKLRLDGVLPKPEGATWAPPLEFITDIKYRTDEEGYLKPGYTHVFVAPTDGGAPRQLTFGPYNERGPLSWSTDCRQLYVSGNRNEHWQREPIDTELYEISVADGAIKPLTTRFGRDIAPLVSPNGSKLAWLGLEGKLRGYRAAELFVSDRRSGADSRSLTASLDRSITSAQWDPDGRGLYVQYDDRSVTKIAHVDLNGRIEPVIEGLRSASLYTPYTGGEFSVSRNGVVAFTDGRRQRLSEVSIVQRGRVRQLTNLNDALFADKTLAEIRPLNVRSSVDQRPIDAWLVTPPDFDRRRKYPMILEIHGGPYTAYGPMFSTDHQLYAAAGYVVLYCNPRGSTSYGAEFANLIHHRYPSEDYDDLMSAVDAAIAEGYVDADNLFVTGASGGGVLTAWTVGKTSRFRAAVAQKPIINWVSTVLTTDLSIYMSKYWFDKLPWQDPETYWKYSPLSLVGSVSTPTLLIVGDRDFRTPLSDSEQYYQALQIAGVDTGLVIVPGASHAGLTPPSQAAARVSTILAWFKRYRRES